MVTHCSPPGLVRVAGTLGSTQHICQGVQTHQGLSPTVGRTFASGFGQGLGRQLAAHFRLLCRKGVVVGIMPAPDVSGLANT